MLGGNVKVKVSYVLAETVDQLQEEVNKEIEAIQLNVNNRILNIFFDNVGEKLVAQVTYAELEKVKEPLMEGENVFKN